MTRIDFYILAETGLQALEVLSCRLAEKAYRAGHTVYVHSASPAQAQQLDELLWSFRAGSFVPHDLASEPSDPPPPVLIGCGDEPPATDVLINLSPEAPEFFNRFERVAELVDQDATRRRQGRERYRFYRDRGYPPHSHNVQR